MKPTGAPEKAKAEGGLPTAFAEDALRKMEWDR
jgi:hypothetical protein